MMRSFTADPLMDVQVMDLGHTYDHKVYLPDPVRDSLAC